MGEEFTPEEIILGVSQGVKDGTICPYSAVTLIIHSQLISF